MYTAKIENNRIIIDVDEAIQCLKNAREQYEKYKNCSYTEQEGSLRAYYESELHRLCKLFQYSVDEFLKMSWDEWKKDQKSKQNKQQKRKTFIRDKEREIV